MTEDDTFKQLKRKDAAAIYLEWMNLPWMQWESDELTKWFKDRHWDKEEWYDKWSSYSNDRRGHIQGLKKKTTS